MRVMSCSAVMFYEERHARNKPILWIPKGENDNGKDSSSVVLVASGQMYHSLIHDDDWKTGDRCLKTEKDEIAVALTERSVRPKVHPLLHHWSIQTAAHFDQYRCVAHSWWLWWYSKAVGVVGFVLKCDKLCDPSKKDVVPFHCSCYSYTIPSLLLW